MAATWPAVRDAGDSFLAEGRPGHGEAAPGDHLQTAYRLWLVGHQLERGDAPWRDPYSFQPIVEPQPNPAGWPFGLPFWPLHALLGTVLAWNAFVLGGYLAAGALAFLWLRALELHLGAAVAGGLAFALAPYLQTQSAAGHLLAWTALLLPLALWAFERGGAWRALAVAALASIPLSGQLHLTLGAIPFFVAYAAVRGSRLFALGAGVAAVAAGLLVRETVIEGSVGAGGRSFAQVERYSADLADLVAREQRHGIESFVLLGWATPLLALAGLAVLLSARRLGLAAALGLGALVPSLLALGANLPGYETLWRHLPGLRETRVPERLMPVACLCLAALVAFAIDRVRLRGAATVALLVVALDLTLGFAAYRPTAADKDNEAYAALRSEPPGRLLELPVVLPDRQEASVYLYYAMQAPRERPAGYSTVAPVEVDRRIRALREAACRGTLGRELRTLGVRYVAVHGGLNGCSPRPGGEVVGRDGRITIVRTG